MHLNQRVDAASRRNNSTDKFRLNVSICSFFLSNVGTCSNLAETGNLGVIKAIRIIFHHVQKYLFRTSSSIKFEIWELEAEKI